MARMIPSCYDEAKTGYGERHVFHALEQLSDEYTVFHSLGLTGHDYKLYAELDFVVVCRQGVLCLEVKGGQIRRSKGVWVFSRGGSYYEKTESPFRQANSAANALRNHVAKNLGRDHIGAKTCYAYGVMFPDISFRRNEPEADLDLVYDRDSGDVKKYVEQVFSCQRKRLEKMHGIVPAKLDHAGVEVVADYLRGDFGFVPTLGTALERTEGEIVRLTQQQLAALEAVAGNERILLQGGAGTGKTLLSVEHARKMAAAGKQVLFVCYNHNLAYHLQARVRRLNPRLAQRLRVCIFLRLLEDELKQIGALPPKPDSSQDQSHYWNCQLPQAFSDAAAQLDLWPCDYLVVDEGQDLLRMEYLTCLDMLVRGGLSAGQWLMAYDPNQNLYNVDVDEGLALLAGSGAVKYTLQINCRNTRQIIDYATKATGIAAGGNLSLDGPEVEVRQYSDAGQLKRMLGKLVGKLLSQGIKPRDICILSGHRLENSPLRDSRLMVGTAIQDIGDLPPGEWNPHSIRYCTLYRFKGLESQVVIFIGSEDGKEEGQQVCSYTAMSRAKVLLYVFHSGETSQAGETNTTRKSGGGGK